MTPTDVLRAALDDSTTDDRCSDAWITTLAAAVIAADTPDERLTARRDELARTISYWRWCWDCGSRLADCQALRPDRKCCPDCRHRGRFDGSLNGIFEDAAAGSALAVLRDLVAHWDDEDRSLPTATDDTWQSVGERLGRTSRDLRRRGRAVVAAATDREEAAAGLPLPNAAASSHPDGPFVLCVDEAPIVQGAGQAVLPPHVSLLLDMMRHARTPAPILNEAGYVDLDATYRTGTPASDALVAESRALAVQDQLARAYHVRPDQVARLVADARDARAQVLADEQADVEARQDDA